MFIDENLQDKLKLVPYEIINLIKKRLGLSILNEILINYLNIGVLNNIYNQEKKGIRSINFSHGLISLRLDYDIDINDVIENIYENLNIKKELSISDFHIFKKENNYISINNKYIVMNVFLKDIKQDIDFINKVYESTLKK